MNTMLIPRESLRGLGAGRDDLGAWSPLSADATGEQQRRQLQDAGVLDDAGRIVPEVSGLVETLAHATTMSRVITQLPDMAVSLSRVQDPAGGTVTLIERPQTVSVRGDMDDADVLDAVGRLVGLTDMRGEELDHTWPLPDAWGFAAAVDRARCEALGLGDRDSLPQVWLTDALARVSGHRMPEALPHPAPQVVAEAERFGTVWPYCRASVDLQQGRVGTDGTPEASHVVALVFEPRTIMMLLQPRPDQVKVLTTHTRGLLAVIAEALRDQDPRPPGTVADGGRADVEDDDAPWWAP